MYRSARTALLVLLAGSAVAVPATARATPAPAQGSSAIPGVMQHYDSEGQALDAASSTRIGPGDRFTFAYSTPNGYYTTTESSPAPGRATSLLYSANFYRCAHSLTGVTLYCWSHYTEWAATCCYVTNRIQNSFYNWSTFVGWSYAGLGSYVYNQIVGSVWYAGRQGHYQLCFAYCVQNTWPWHTGIYGGGGYWSTYGWSNG